MTGPEHYKHAERLLEKAKKSPGPLIFAQAQVHATLAHAAAVIDQRRSPDSKVAAAWDEVTR